MRFRNLFILFIVLVYIIQIEGKGRSSGSSRSRSRSSSSRSRSSGRSSSDECDDECGLITGVTIGGIFGTVFLFLLVLKLRSKYCPMFCAKRNDDVQDWEMGMEDEELEITTETPDCDGGSAEYDGPTTIVCAAGITTTEGDVVKVENWDLTRIQVMADKVLTANMYFEVNIVKMSSKPGSITIGVTTKDSATPFDISGGYSSDGSVYGFMNPGVPLGQYPPYGEGDVIGCGFEVSSDYNSTGEQPNTVFFSKNGELLDPTILPSPWIAGLLPMAILEPEDCVEFNFGQKDTSPLLLYEPDGSAISKVTQTEYDLDDEDYGLSKPLPPPPTVAPVEQTPYVIQSNQIPAALEPAQISALPPGVSPWQPAVVTPYSPASNAIPGQIS